jgi:glycine/D-amino acid oxidase-like deaminating enzyme
MKALSPKEVPKEIQTDIAIIGGGIAGLWCQRRLSQLGYSTLLLEQHTLGAGQTSKAQGIIHGGIKYALLGTRTQASDSIANQPQRWQACFAGHGEIDLSGVHLNATHHDLWTIGGFSSALKHILIQQTLASQGYTLPKAEYPAVFQNTQFKGHLYRVHETVIDVYSLIEQLAKPLRDYSLQIDSGSCQFDGTSLSAQQHQNHFVIHAQYYLFTAGAGNQALHQFNPIFTPTQLRPLHMVMAKLPTPLPLFAHCVDHRLSPRITITSHSDPQDPHHSMIWYFGGWIAETGITRSARAQIQATQAEMQTLFPWINTQDWLWDCFMINRAEPFQSSGQRYPGAFFETHHNIGMGFPSKLALAPSLSDHVLAAIHQQGIQPRFPSLTAQTLGLQSPALAKPFFESLIAPISTPSRSTV